MGASITGFTTESIAAESTIMELKADESDKGSLFKTVSC